MWRPVPDQPQSPYPWGNTGHSAITEAPVFIGEFGTGNRDADLYTTGAGSQGQWMTSLVNFIESSYAGESPLNESGVPVSNLHWSYWALNDEDAYALLGPAYAGLENPRNENSIGSVMPVRNDVSAAEIMMPPTLARFSGRAHRQIASAAAGSPHILKRYPPARLPAVGSPAVKR